MSILMRAPEECASWEWELNEFASPGLDSALMAAAQISELLCQHHLLDPNALEWMWAVYGFGGVGVITKLPVTGKLDEVELAQRIEQSRPSGFPDAKVGAITISGRGAWFDAEGEQRHEADLVTLTVSPDEHHLSAEVAVFHDIWGYFNFKGVPHPEIQRRNAPRLAAALRALESLLGATARPGDPTYFGCAEGYGIEMPDMIDGLGPDLTDRL
ncbi:hypothetical protein OHU11_19880 [Streptomyces sp. NBC_00257]|uniref:hypothetical protein n=1 Tax=Streptomyces TaxID=1883 RepID=UPI0022586FEC|nr:MULTISPECIES: hypothetical protein [unclassified Streptomyces]WTB55905.1 hypothetical protein OG832_23505 [Streptomyces sp. NBC_00826]WTH91213.1 hypothetical protein OIC43_20190 [Streptomyces sp. NBC_00825]WTH99939.1 hypothetical protein OHA23_20175 [Streptomyces sp. NBC_00822]MCX4865413.1 hypothetical protein [Streptomyces sp. NBC_00906]MCX4896651.1 hypothetical protein [Streptomyces sp. NBC_00892]